MLVNYFPVWMTRDAVVRQAYPASAGPCRSWPTARPFLVTDTPPCVRVAMAAWHAVTNAVGNGATPAARVARIGPSSSLQVLLSPGCGLRRSPTPRLSRLTLDSGLTTGSWRSRGPCTHVIESIMRTDQVTEKYQTMAL